MNRMKQTLNTAQRVLSRFPWHAFVVFTLAWIFAAATAMASERVTTLTVDDPGSMSSFAGAGLFGGFAAAILAQMLLGGSLWLLTRAAMRRAGRARLGVRTRHTAFAALCGLAGAFPCWLLGTELAAGGWITQQGWAWMVRYLVAAMGGLGLFAVVRVALLVATRPASSYIAGALGVAGAVVMTQVDSRMLEGTYPEIHLAAFLVSSLLAWTGFSLALRPAISRPPPLWSRLTALFAVLVCCAATGFWTLMDRATRTELLLGSPVAANVIHYLHPNIGTPTYLMSELGALDPGEGVWEPVSGRPRGLIEGLNDYNVILVVVDTLRADALPPARKKDSRLARRSDTPFFNRWMKDAYTFEHAYAQAPITHRSMPPMFRSLQACEDPHGTGVPLATAMALAGLIPFAVVNNFFLEPRYEPAQRLLDGFEHVEIYDKNRQEEIVELTRKMVQRLSGDPFFAWIHFYNMHAPGYDGKIQSEKLSLPRRYRRSLKWLDRQMQALVDVLADEGELDRTIIVLTADHGENLGDNGMNYHGRSVFEEELRVPVAIRIPGHRGRVIEETIGNIDLVPTILDLLGRPADPKHRGRSLVPLMAGQGPGPLRPYYLQNRNGTSIGLVLDRQKLIYDRKAEAFYRFDLADDPTEDVDLYDPESEIDKRLRRLLFQVDPALVAKELKGTETRALLARRISQIDPDRPGAAVDFLVRLGAVAKTDTVMTEALGLFDRSGSDELKLLLVEHLFDHDPGWGERVMDHLDELRGTPREQRFVTALATSGVSIFTEERVVSRLEQIADAPADEWEPWLRLIARWETRSSRLAGVYDKMLDRAWSEAAPPRTVNLLFESVRTHDFGRAGASRNLRRQARRFLEHPESFARIAALRTAAHLGDDLAVPAIEAFVRGEGADDVRVRQAAIHALASLRGEAAVDAIAKAGEDIILTLDALKALKKIKSPKALPFMKNVAKNHYNWIIRKYAKAAVKSIEKQ